jgi:hypothetical protein
MTTHQGEMGNYRCCLCIHHHHPSSSSLSHNHLLLGIFPLWPDLNGEHLVFAVWLWMVVVVEVHILLHQGSHWFGDHSISGGWRLLGIGVGGRRQWWFVDFEHLSVEEDLDCTANDLSGGDELEKEGRNGGIIRLNGQSKC